MLEKITQELMKENMLPLGELSSKTGLSRSEILKAANKADNIEIVFSDKHFDPILGPVLYLHVPPEEPEAEKPERFHKLKVVLYTLIIRIGLRVVLSVLKLNKFTILVKILSNKKVVFLIDELIEILKK